MKKIIALCLFMCFVWSSPLLATPSPLTTLESTSHQMIDALKKNRSSIKNNPAYAEQLARSILLPHVDVPSMSRLVLGRDAWIQATASEKSQFMDEFSTFMIRTYSTALSSYTNESIRFLPLRDNYEQQSRMLVKSLILQQGGPSIPVDYRVILKGDDWMLYDITVDGVSMVRSFRSQFNNELQKSGMSGLLLAMKKHNEMKK